MARITDLPPEILGMVFLEMRHHTPDSTKTRRRRLSAVLPRYMLCRRRDVLRANQKEFKCIQLVSKYWRAVVMDIKFPSFIVWNERYEYGFDASGFWYTTTFIEDQDNEAMKRSPCVARR